MTDQSFAIVKRNTASSALVGDNELVLIGDKILVSNPTSGANRKGDDRVISLDDFGQPEQSNVGERNARRPWSSWAVSIGVNNERFFEILTEAFADPSRNRFFLTKDLIVDPPTTSIDIAASAPSTDAAPVAIEEPMVMKRDVARIGALITVSTTALALLAGLITGVTYIHPLLGVILLISSAAFYLMSWMKPEAR